MEFEVKIRFQGLNPHPVFQVTKLEHKTTPAPFIVTYVDFNRDPTPPDLTYGKIMFYSPYSGLKYTTYTILKHVCSQTIYKKYFTPSFVTLYILIQYLLNLLIHIIIFLQMIQILQILWFPTMTVKNNIRYFETIQFTKCKTMY